MLKQGITTMIINKNKLKFLATVFSLTSMLTACGGGSEDSPAAKSEPITTPVVTGVTEEEFGLYLSDLSKNHILPAYQALQDNSTAFKNQSSTFCSIDKPSQNELNELQQSWRAVNLSWQNISWIKVGPVVEDNRIFRIHYWPGGSDYITSAIDDLLLSNEEVTESFISKQRVGIQGLVALELLLFNKDKNLATAAGSEKRCQVLQAISANVVTISTSINQAWQSSGGNYVEQFNQGTGEFSSKKDAIEELVTNWLEQLERVKDEKMLKPLEKNLVGEVENTEFPLSAASIASIKANVNTFKVIYLAGGGHGFDDILIEHLGQQNIATQMLSSIDDTIASLEKVEESLAEMLKTEQGRAEVNQIVSNLRVTRDLLTADFVQATDINIGFNSNDGD